MSEKKPNLDSLFLQALEIESPAERGKFLTRTCGDDATLRQEVDRLLASHQVMGSFLETPARELAATVVSDITRHDLTGVMNAGLASAFGENEAVVIGRAHHSALQGLGQTINIPCVALREVADSKDPVVRPLSSELPEHYTDGRYQLEGEIARGGMGAILKGRDIDLGRELAIKVLLDDHMNRPEVVQRFIEEAQIGGQLQHPGIAPVYELGQFSDRRPFFSMKLVKGETLSKLLSDRADPAADRGKFLKIFEQVCQTMAYAHSRGVVHRDLKPTNVMVGAFGEVQVMDWGLAKVLSDGGAGVEQSSQPPSEPNHVQTLRSGVGSDQPGSRKQASHTQVGSVMGTPAYMPPEQALGHVDHLDERADVFGLGAILCEILTGLPPYVGNEKTTVFHLASHGKLDDCLARLASCGADGDLIALAKHCLEVDAKDRPRDASVLAQRVSSYLQSVENKLHETETERAVQAARAEQQLQAAGKLRQLIAGLAVVAMIAVTTSLVAGKFWSDAAIAERLATESAQRATEHRLLAEQNLAKAEASEQVAKTQSQRADHEAEVAQRNLYFAQMHLAQQTWREHRGLAHMRELLASWLPKEKAPDRRGWEWFYIKSLPHQNLRTLKEGGISAKPGMVAWNIASGRLAEGTSDGVIRIWDVEREQVTRTLHAPSPWSQYWGGAWFAWRPDGGQLVTAGKDGSVQIWDSSNGKAVKSLQGPGDTTLISVAFSSDGNRVAGWTFAGKIRVWDARTAELTIEKSHPPSVTAGAWSPDDQHFACGHNNGTVTISSATDGDAIITLPGHTGTIEDLTWSPDSKRLASASYDFTARIWDIATQKMVLGPLRHSHEVTNVAWEQGGNRLATGSIDETVKIWDTTTGRDMYTLRGHEQSLTGLSWGPQGRLATGANHGSVKIWTTVRDQESAVLPGHGARATAVAWSPDGSWLASGGDDGQIRIWNAAREQVKAFDAFGKVPISGQFGLIRSVAWSPDGVYLAASGLTGGAKVWEVASERLVCNIPADRGAIWCVAWSPSGKSLAMGCEDGSIGILEQLQEKPDVRFVQAHRNRIRALGWSPQGDRLASSAWMELGTFVCNLQGVELARLPSAHSVLNLSWSSDGKQLATSSTDFTATIWNMATTEEKTSEKAFTLRGHHDFVDGVKWSPDGSRLVTAGLDNTVRVWDAETGDETLVLRGDAGFFHDVAWHPDGAQIAAASSDGQIWIWDARRGFERDATARALPYLDRLVASGALRGEEILTCAESYLQFGQPQKALAAVNNDSAALTQLARRADELGLITVADAARRQVRTILEHKLAADPDNQGLASELADLLLVSGDQDWTVVRPTEMKSAAGATLKLQDDGSIWVSGPNTHGDVYTLTADIKPGAIACVRLEALPEQSLPNRGPGRHSSGNFQLSAMRLNYPASSDGSGSIPLPLTAVWANFDYKAFDADVQGTIDEKLAKVWHIWGRFGERHQALFSVQNNTQPHGDRLIIELRHKLTGFPVNLGRFRLSVSSDPHLFAREQRRHESLAKVRQIDDAWGKLAAAYYLVNDQPKLDKLLQEHPEAAVGIGDLRAVEHEWEQAIALYSKVITDQTTNASWLAKRGAAYAALQQWPQSRADWLRAVELDGTLTVPACEMFWSVERWREAAEFGLQAIERTPTDTTLWVRFAPLAAMSDDQAAYAQFCQKVLSLVAERSEADAADRAIKGCLLLPGVIEPSKLPLAALVQALDESKTTPAGYLPWFWGTRALVAYRTGEAKLALEYLAKSAQYQPYLMTRAMNGAVLALAQQKLEHPEEARRALQESAQLIANRKKDGQLDADLLVAEILWREADKLINPPQP